MVAGAVLAAALSLPELAGNLDELDLTFDEEHVPGWPALARGFRALVDNGGVEARLRSDLDSWRPSEVDATDLERLEQAAPISSDPDELLR